MNGLFRYACIRANGITTTSPRPSPPGEGDSRTRGMGRIGQIGLNKTNKKHRTMKTTRICTLLAMLMVGGKTAYAQSCQPFVDYL